MEANEKEEKEEKRKEIATWLFKVQGLVRTKAHGMVEENYK